MTQNLIDQFNDALKEVQRLSRELRLVNRSLLRQTSLYQTDDPVPVLSGLLSSPRCGIYGNRKDLLASLCDYEPKSVCEIGVLHGAFSQYILETFKDLERLILIDRSFSKLSHALDAAKPRNCKIQYLEGNSSSLLIDNVQDNSLDIIYIDGDHSYSGVTKDANAALAKVKSGGFIIFNDYTNYNADVQMPYGTLHCVHKLLHSSQAKIHALSLSPVDLKDICLQVL